MTLEFLAIQTLNGISYGLLLFMLASGLTLIFSMMGVLNFAHASFYMLGAYVAYAVAQQITIAVGGTIYGPAGFWAALVLSPLLVGLLGASIERYGLRRVHRLGPVAELLFTFGLSYIIVELVQVIWGRPSVPYRVPAALDHPLFKLFSSSYPTYRVFMMGVAVAMLLAIRLLLTRTRIGLVIQAALTHPQMVEALGHNVPRVFMLVFGGGVALAALAGVIGGNAFVTEPAMAASVGAIVFVVIVVGGMGSLIGAFIASLAIGLIQTFAITSDASLASGLRALGAPVTPATAGYGVLSLSLAQIAPVLPYLLLVLMLIVRPRGLLGTRED